MTTTPQSWHVTYSTANADGNYVGHKMIYGSELEARIAAAALSREHAHANVSNREGYVATYVGGRLSPAQTGTAT